MTSRRGFLAGATGMTFCSSDLLEAAHAREQGTGAVARNTQSKLQDFASVKDFGAIGDGVTDDLAAFNLAKAQVAPGGVFHVPPGTYALSAKFQYDRLRSRVVADGLIVPHSSNTGGDYLWEFINTASGGDPLIADLALNVEVDRLTIDGRFTNRGVRMQQVYNSSFKGLRIFKAYGTSLACDYGFENTFLGTLISGGKRRTASWLGTETDWAVGAAYTVGQRVRRTYAAWSNATTYRANNLVVYNDALYRAVSAGNTNRQPDTNPVWWQGIPFEYFECMIAHTGFDPHSATGNTTNSAVAGNKYWKQIYHEEAALEIVCTLHTEVVDHHYFYGLDMRHCSNRVMVRLDNQVNERRVTGVEFYGAMMHMTTSGYISVMNASPHNAGYVAPVDSVIVQLGHTMRCRLVNCTIRSADTGERVTHIQLGHINPDKLVQNHVITGCNLSGELSSQYGISIMPGVTASTSVASNNEFSFTSGTTSPRTVGDTSRLVALKTERDMIAATTPGNFTATHYFRITDASGTTYLVPARRGAW